MAKGIYSDWEKTEKNVKSVMRILTDMVENSQHLNKSWIVMTVHKIIVAKRCFNLQSKTLLVNESKTNCFLGNWSTILTLSANNLQRKIANK